jgi:hypothetical protein
MKTLLIVAALNVSSACRSDYLSYCAHTQPYSVGCKACMRSHLGKLSLSCKLALKAAGYKR